MIEKNEIHGDDEPKIVRTDEGAENGQNKCPKCGATDISLNVNNGLLRCNFCRTEFEPETVTEEADLSQLRGQTIGSGAQDIIADTNDMLTLKCKSCAAEVVIDTSQKTQSRCHWCRNTLSINQQVPNGAVPDMVLPFSVKKDIAKAEIEHFVGKRKFFAHPEFKKEFSTENVMGVYLPYMVVDVNSHATLIGRGERLIRTYTRGTEKKKKTYYDADLYEVEREFDLVVDDLTIEASSDKIQQRGTNKTNNIINAIMPFDTENAVKWNANYIKGYTSEKRDTNIDALRDLVDAQSKDIARHKANETLREYDRGVRWTSETLEVKGQSWKSAYLPVWLYSYQQVKGGGNTLLHYVAVNARTKETVGSVPIHTPKLVLVSLIIQLLGLCGAIVASMFTDSNYQWLLLLSGFLYFFFIYLKYRNTNARHTHEKETRADIDHIRKTDVRLKRLTGLTNATMSGANNFSVSKRK